MRHWDLERFRHMCIMAGCDYLDSPQGVGIKKALGFLHAKPAIRVIQSWKMYGKTIGAPPLPQDYLERFHLADFAFKHQRVYDPELRRLVTLRPLIPGESYSSELMRVIGPDISPDIAASIATGDRDPITRELFETVPSQNNTLATHTKVSMGSKHYLPLTYNDIQSKKPRIASQPITISSSCSSQTSWKTSQSTQCSTYSAAHAYNSQNENIRSRDSTFGNLLFQNERFKPLQKLMNVMKTNDRNKLQQKTVVSTAASSHFFSNVTNTFRTNILPRSLSDHTVLAAVSNGQDACEIDDDETTISPTSQDVSQKVAKRPRISNIGSGRLSLRPHNSSSGNPSNQKQLHFLSSSGSMSTESPPKSHNQTSTVFQNQNNHAGKTLKSFRMLGPLKRLGTGRVSLNSVTK